MLASWSIGVLIGVPILALWLLGCLVGLIFGVLGITDKDSYNKGGAWAWTSGVVVVTLITLGLSLWAYYPLKKEYHYWTETSGVVQTIDKRIVPNGDGISEKYVVRYTDDRERGCLDTRCGSVRPGDTLVLTCKRAWQYTGTDGYDCNFVENRRQ